ncbi:MAG: 5,10-methylenetetrahydromethanopterin reductase [Candidatus Thorarchaeota archaeon]|nr:5,10-methylenetetrahydromethanopterin reductase [Candidatus Thorarchaeota archaeon]
MVLLGIEFVPDRPVKEIVECARLAEQVGFDHVWITDHYNNRNLWCTLTAIALNTSHVKIGPGVTNPYHTSPALSAAAVVTLNEISHGRAVVGMGAGDRVTLETLGLKWHRPVTTVIESIQSMRALIQGKRLTLDGKVFQFRRAKLSSVPRRPLLDESGKAVYKDGKVVKTAPHIPIYAGAQGPTMLRRVAPYVDGILINASHPRDFDAALKSIRTGLKGTGRDISDLDIGAYTAFSIAPTREEALSGDTRMVVAFIVAGSPDEVIERHGLTIEQREQIARLLENGDFDGASQAVTEEMIESFAIVGDRDYCIERIEDLLKTGVTHFIVGSPIGPDRREAIKMIGRELIPYFKEARS